MRSIGQEVNKIGRVIFSKTKPVVIIVAIDIVGIYAVAAFILRHVEARRHNTSNIGRPYVQPFLLWPSIQGFAQVRLLEFGDIWSPVFVAPCGKITDDFASFTMQARDERYVGVE